LRRYGIPSSGALDQFSYRAATLLLGNPPGAPALEVTFGSVILQALTPVQAAITGGDLAAQINDSPAPLWTVFALQAGDRLSFTRPVEGCRAYLGIRGGFDGPTFMGSKATFTKGQMGRPLKAGDTLSTQSFMTHFSTSRAVPAHYRPNFGPHQIIRVIVGPQADYFSAGGMETFLGQEYTLDSKSDRQGFRLRGPPIEIARGPDIISDPTPLGAIQVPGDGNPIILMRDGQVTGGYAKIAVVIRADIDRLAQTAPGQCLRFQSVSREAGLCAQQENERILNLIPAMVV
jgi:antagonist of KipI